GGVRFGIDPLLNILPIGGSAIGLFFSMYIVWIAYRHDVPLYVIGRMVLYVVVDFLVGLVPFIGWAGDFFIRANIKNLKLLHQYLDHQPIDGSLIDNTKLIAK